MKFHSCSKDINDADFRDNKDDKDDDEIKTNTLSLSKHNQNCQLI